MLIRIAVAAASIGLVVSSAALAQTDLSMFSGSPVQPAEVKRVCDARIALNQPGYFPFCGTVIATHLGDEQFREFYEGDGNNPFITASQAQAFARQADRVAALRGTPATCLGSNLDACLATLSTALFVTSHPFEPQWIPGEPMVENQSLEFIGFKPPVYDELARFDRQLNREVGLGLIVAPGERVIAVAIRASLKEANLTYAVKSGLLEALHAANPTCQPAGLGVQALKQVLNLSLEDGDSGAFTSAKLVLCGRLAEVFRFQPTSSGIDTPAQRITITFREQKPRAKLQRPATAVKR